MSSWTKLWDVHTFLFQYWELNPWNYAIPQACFYFLARINRFLIWEKKVRGGKCWAVANEIFALHGRCLSVHHLLLYFWEIFLLSPLPSSSSSSSSSSSVYKMGPSESESLDWYSLGVSSSGALKDSEESPVCPAFPNSSLVAKLWRARKQRVMWRTEQSLWIPTPQQAC